jgi:hypothetical protein
MGKFRIQPLAVFLGGVALALALAGAWRWLAGDGGRSGAEGPDAAGSLEAVKSGAVPGAVEDPLVAEPQAVSGIPELPTLADILEQTGDLSVPGNRERAVAMMREVERARRESMEAEARRLGLPLRVEGPDGAVREFAGFENGRPVWFTTHNVNAAISTGAKVLNAPPYSLDGAGLTVGMWDGGGGRASHQEFAIGSRMVVKDGAASIDHATHVGGTLAAAGVVANARGMAPAVTVDSYDWNNDKSEMTARAAAAPNEAGKLYLSNHSYGYVSGWTFTGGSGSPARTWEWWGDGTTASGYEHDFGRYNTFARDSDALAHSAPYYLMVRSAGNDRTDNPSEGQSVALSPGSSTVVSYSSASHPPGDGVYRGGFETIGFDALGKNVLTVGSVTDAVTGGARDPSKANQSSFSSWGPTDDGRIKPDVVANGDGVYSSLNGGNASYGTFSGTSMAAPNAAGTAMLLIQEYARLFDGGAMRASTLRGLLIHTADDRGHPGPDYKFGWGLVNGVAAADLLHDHAENPLKARLSEDLITSSNATRAHEFVWDGVSPIRATLSWTDPAGAATSTNDLRTPRLVNNLNLRITGPDGSEHLPYMMPFVGAWTQASMDQPAVTGVNNTDNVEQVFIAAPPASGVYRCVVTFSGTLANNQQRYSLLISGSANEQPPPPPLTVEGVAPGSALPGVVTMDLTGTGFKSGAAVALTRAGQPDIMATGVTLPSPSSLRCQLDLSGAAAGLWSVRVTNPDSETFTLAAAFQVIGAIWSESFDGTVSGWQSQATTGSNEWTLSTARSHSPPSSYFAPGPSSKTTCSLTSPAISIPSSATNLQFRFWHWFSLQSGQDGGKLEFSINGGAWFDVVSSNSGAAFASNGYNTTINNTGKPADRSEFAGTRAWSGNSGDFVETVVNLTDAAKFAGKSLRARWRIATNASIASTGWHVDSVALVGGGDPVNQAPMITAEATTDSGETFTDPDDGSVFHIVRGASAGLTVAASDDGGAAGLTYTWSGTRTGGGESPSFVVNGTNTAKNTTVWFESAGDYVLTVTVTDAQGLAASSSVSARVLQTASALSVTPATASVTVGGGQLFAAMELDQFGQPMAAQPPSFSWTVTGGGVIGADGLFTAATAGGPYVVHAASGGLSGLASVTVNPAPAAVTLGQLTQTFDGSPKPVSVSTLPAGLEVRVTYDGLEAAPAAVGSYAVEALVTDPNYQGSASGLLMIEPRQFVLTVGGVPGEGGSVTGGGSFVEGSVAGVGAVAADCWRFVGWTGEGIADPGQPVTTVLMDASRTVTAHFEKIPSYEEWAEANELEGEDFDPAADPDGDGYANLLEFALGSDPNQRDNPIQIEVESDEVEPEARRLVMRFSRPAGLPGVTYHCWFSGDLQEWRESADMEVTPNESDGTESVVVRDVLPAGPAPRFGKLEVRLDP